MNPLSFVTAFTVGELGSVFALVFAFDGGTKAAIFHSPQTIHLLFWLFLGGFVWVIGDLFQQFAAKYLGIGRGIPLSNTNQIWGLAWGALVFGELENADTTRKLMVIIGSVVMILGALAISSAVATAREHSSTNDALVRECNRYGLDYQRVLRSYGGSEFQERGDKRSWWDYLIVATALAVFVYLGINARVPALNLDARWACVLVAVMIATAVSCGWGLWKASRFS
jgi:hypothetical protein